MWRGVVEKDLAAAGLDVVGTAASGTEAINRARALRPDVIVVDLNIPAPTGVEVIAALLQEPVPDPRPRFLVLSASGERGDVLAAMTAGATGYLVKSATTEELISAVGEVARGEAVFTPGLASMVLGEFGRLASLPDTNRPQLTERETEVLRYVAKGLTYRAIAERMYLSHRTVQNHVQNSLRKLQLSNRSQLVRYAIDHGIDDDS